MYVVSGSRMAYCRLQEPRDKKKVFSKEPWCFKQTCILKRKLTPSNLYLERKSLKSTVWDFVQENWKQILELGIFKTLPKLLKMPKARLLASWRAGQQTRELGCEGYFKAEVSCMVHVFELGQGKPQKSHLPSRTPAASLEAQVAVKHENSSPSSFFYLTVLLFQRIY